MDPEVVFEVSHLLEHLFAVVDAAHKKLTPSNCCIVCGLDVKVLWKRVYRFYSVVCKQSSDAF